MRRRYRGLVNNLTKFKGYVGDIFSPYQGPWGQKGVKPRVTAPVKVDTTYYAELTDSLLATFYPQQCCGEVLTKPDTKREGMLRCPSCRKRKSKLSGSPLQFLHLPRWMFGYLLKESELLYPQVLTISQIARRVGVGYSAATRLKRRLQIFAATAVLPRMQERFYTEQKLRFAGFKLPKDRNADITELVKDKPIPQADTVVLYSCRTASNKGRKRFRRKGQTSSIYMSESLGGMQKGTLAQTVGVKQGPVFYDSIPNQKAETILPVLSKYVPYHSPLFTDEGYRGYRSAGHRMINHSRKSSDKRYKWSRQRWSKNGVHSNVAEGRNGVLKRGFAAYTWINPRHSRLYLGEFSMNANLRHFALKDLIPAEGNPEAGVRYQLDKNWERARIDRSMWAMQDSNLRPPACKAGALTS